MSLGGARLKGRSRGAFFALAFIALVLKVFAPPGYMAADRPGALPFPLVLCTSQGRVSLDPSQDGAPAHKSKSEAPCAFAGNGVNATPPADTAVGEAHVTAYQDAVTTAVASLAPGLGLAAPPPPSQGPPVLL